MPDTNHSHSPTYRASLSSTPRTATIERPKRGKRATGPKCPCGCGQQSAQSMRARKIACPCGAATIRLSRLAISLVTATCHYNITRIIDGGRQLRAAVWATPSPREGDYLILRGDRAGGDMTQPWPTTRYRVDGVRPCYDPGDMCFVDLTFAPRA